ncbi:PA14 domain-containing protein, partial [Bacillus sp. V33-4]|uniref:PA14 domain-containing protein n=1 Tax=Bacillus sp. V33-4 TaxID=2054169 RepID=UPI000CB265C2
PTLDFNWGWGNGSPHPSVPGEGFSARFTKKMNLDTGTYLFVADADDGVRVKLNNQVIINNWPNTGTNEKRQDIYLNSGEYTVTVEYFEDVGNANLKFDIKKLSPNRIYYQQNLDVQYHWGNGSPSSFPADGFEAVFDQSGYYPGGDYFLQTFADDGVKVEVDGQLLINRWSDYTGKVDRALWLGVNAGKHSIQTQYYDNVSTAAVFSHVVPLDSWLAYYFPNETLSGMPAASKIIAPAGQFKGLYQDFGDVSISPGVDKDHFSARYTTAKRIPAGNYLIKTRADDGLRVYVDGNLVVDRWSGALGEETIRLQISNRSDAKPGEQDIHWIDVEYYDYVSVGSVQFSIEPAIGPIYLSTNYDRTLAEVVDRQMSVSPQTDLHAKYLREDALTRDANGNWYVTGSGWNVRGGPGTNYPIVGTINNGVPVRILKTISTPGQPTWYQVSAWMNALRNDVEYYVNPTNFSRDSTAYFQFLKLSESAGLDVNEVNGKILNGKGILQGKASSFIEAGIRYGINEVYLISHALLETGNGTSQLATGVMVSQVDGKNVEPRVVYNMYGINAKDSCPLQCGSEYAYKKGWTTPELAIMGGAGFIADGYINRGQDTLYKMRWNPSSPGTNQYATDIGWAVKQVNRIKSLYDLLANYTQVFDEPRYR